MVCRLVQLEMQMEEIPEVIKKLEQFEKKMNGGSNHMLETIMVVAGHLLVDIIVEAIKEEFN